MKSNLPPIFTKVNGDKWSLSKDPLIVTSDVFYFKSTFGYQDRIIVVLTNSHICLCDGSKTRDFDPKNSKVNEICRIDFQLKFQLIKQIPNSQSDPNSLGTPYAITLQKDGHTPLTLFSNYEILVKWKNELQLRINRKGFRNLFRPIKKIGKGSFASVYLAERLEDKKLVAVKAFSKQSSFSQQKGKQAIINEINIMRKLNHPNIMKLYAVHETENSIYLIFEILEGGQLFNKIQSKHKFTKKQTRHMMNGLLQGLQYLSDKRIMHRDLKPENIMLRNNDSLDVVIVDFGLAAWTDENQHLFVRCGTPGYVAPEIFNIFEAKTKGDPSCDVFSVGLIFHILLTGKSIFPSRTPEGILAQNKVCNFNLDEAIYQNIPHEAHDLLKKMLEKNPLTRITSTEALRHPYFTNTQNQDPKFFGQSNFAKNHTNPQSPRSPQLKAENGKQHNYRSPVRNSIYFNIDKTDLAHIRYKNQNLSTRPKSPSIGRDNLSPPAQQHIILQKYHTNKTYLTCPK